MDYHIIKWLHIISSTILFGTGIGSAFYMLVTSLTGDAKATASVVRHVVIADWLFTTPTIILQPLTGFYLVYLLGYPLTSLWLVWTYILYILAGACWLPVVWLQIKMKNLAQNAAEKEIALPALYWRYLKIWIALGIPAFAALIIIFYLMVARPM
jgi:uncharacterized membrane protein